MKEQYYGLILVKRDSILFQSCKKGFCKFPKALGITWGFKEMPIG